MRQKKYTKLTRTKAWKGRIQSKSRFRANKFYRHNLTWNQDEIVRFWGLKCAGRCCFDGAGVGIRSCIFSRLDCSATRGKVPMDGKCLGAISVAAIAAVVVYLSSFSPRGGQAGISWELDSPAKKKKKKKKKKNNRPSRI